MTADEKRITELLDHPNRDEVTAADIPLIRAGLLFLNWTDRPASLGGRCSPFVTPSSTAVKYLEKNKRLTPAHRRTLRSLADRCVKRADIEWAKTHIQPTY